MNTSHHDTCAVCVCCLRRVKRKYIVRHRRYRKGHGCCAGTVIYICVLDIRVLVCLLDFCWFVDVSHVYCVFVFLVVPAMKIQIQNNVVFLFDKVVLF